MQNKIKELQMETLSKRICKSLPMSNRSYSNVDHGAFISTASNGLWIQESTLQ